MTADELAEYRRRLELREQRRRDVETAVGWTPAPGRVWWWEDKGER